MRLIDVPQGSAAWLEARTGKVTASRIVDVLDQLKKGGEGAYRRNYRIELLAERLSGKTEDHYVSPEMAFGTEFENDARTAYEIETDAMVEQAGFVLHPTLDYAGASPDGLVGDDGLIEIKVPKTTTHLKWMLAGVVPEEHQAQCIWNMVCCERKWADFVSFDPRLPDGLKLFTVRMVRDDERVAQIEQEVIRFNDELEALTAELRIRIKETPPQPVDTRPAYEQCMEMVDRMELVP